MTHPLAAKPRATVVLAIAAVLLLISTAPMMAKNVKTIIITNTHKSFLSVRCFSFDDSFSVVHLKPWAQYRFNITVRSFYPSATMFNCSTNMGSFVAFRYDYGCNFNDTFETCEWRFDEKNAYRYDPLWLNWTTYDYDPNYESLTRGGVIKGYYAN